MTAAKGVNFTAVASHTSHKYLLETMGSGVAVFDYDNDGRLDLFFVNGAPLEDPMQKGAVPQKRTPKDSYHWYRDVIRSNGARLRPHHSKLTLPQT